MDDLTLARKVSSQPNNHIEDNKRLAREDWLLAALSLLTKEGFSAVSIARLSKELNVTRGSFYWHFKNLVDLHTTIVAFWTERNKSYFHSIASETKSLSDGILSFFSTATDPETFDPWLDRAMREWASKNEKIRKILEKSDNENIESLSLLFNRFGYEDKEANVRAKVMYYTQVGFFSVHSDLSLDDRLSFLELYYKVFTGENLSNEAASNFKKQIKNKK